MSEEIKNFDRAIEQMMNESSVAPPFGMWNRISTELDAEALPVAATQAPASFPGKAVTGFAAVLILGISVASFYFFGNQQKQVLRTSAIETSLTTATVNEVVPANSVSATPALEKTVEVLVAKEKYMAKVNYKSISPSEVAIAVPVKEELPTVTVISIPQKSAIAETAMNDTYTSANANDYFFPPIDINVGQLKDAASEESEKEDLQEDKASEKKIKTFSGSNDKRVKFKKKKSKGFTYGRLNRLKK